MECRVIWHGFFVEIVQHGEVTGQGGNSRTFQINASVREGCVLSPKMFSSVLHWAMSKWLRWAEGCAFGFDLGDGFPPLLDFRFADDIFIFARSPQAQPPYFDRSRYQREAKGIRSQMVGLHVACGRFQEFNLGY